MELETAPPYTVSDERYGNALALVLDEHRRWITGEGGRRLDLRAANLHGADLRLARLSLADLCDVDLYGANLCGADLSEAKLDEAKLAEANRDGQKLGEGYGFVDGLPF